MVIPWVCGPVGFQGLEGITGLMGANGARKSTVIHLFLELF